MNYQNIVILKWKNKVSPLFKVVILSSPDSSGRRSQVTIISNLIAVSKINHFYLLWYCYCKQSHIRMTFSRGHVAQAHTVVLLCKYAVLSNDEFLRPHLYPWVKWYMTVFHQPLFILFQNIWSSNVLMDWNINNKPKSTCRSSSLRTCFQVSRSCCCSHHSCFFSFHWFFGLNHKNLINLFSKAVPIYNTKISE